jgi:hypothetical protein
MLIEDAETQARAVAAHFSTPLARLAFARRLRFLVTATGRVTTVRDLVLLHPTDAIVSRVGHNTLVSTHRAIRDLLGVTWEQAHAIARNEPTTLERMASKLDEPLTKLMYPSRPCRLIASWPQREPRGNRRTRRWNIST